MSKRWMQNGVLSLLLAGVALPSLAQSGGEAGEGSGETAAQDQAQPTPDPGGEPAAGTHTLQGSFTPDPAVFAVPSGGTLRASSLSTSGGSSCNAAWVPANPSIRIDYQAPSGLPLLFYIDTAGTDPTLAVRTPSGEWHCDDDWNSLMPRVLFDDPEAGAYDIFVGSYLEGETPEVSLHVSEIASNVPRN